jgi:hypothetical protein
VTQGRLAGPEERSTDDSVRRNILGIDAQIDDVGIWSLDTALSAYS